MVIVSVRHNRPTRTVPAVKGDPAQPALILRAGDTWQATDVEAARIRAFAKAGGVEADYVFKPQAADAAPVAPQAADVAPAAPPVAPSPAKGSKAASAPAGG